MKSLAICALLVLVFVLSTACTKFKPESMCAMPSNDQSLEEMIFTQAIREIDQDSSDYSTVDAAAIKSYLQTMRPLHVFSFGMRTFRGFDKDTKTATCGMYVSIHVPKRFKTSHFVEVSRMLLGPKSLGDLFVEKPGVQITYTAQPTADGTGNVITTSDLESLADSVSILAGTDWLMSKLEYTPAMLQKSFTILPCLSDAGGTNCDAPSASAVYYDGPGCFLALSKLAKPGYELVSVDNVPHVYRIGEREAWMQCYDTRQQ